MKRITKKPWFGLKKWGWGYTPVTWEGWISTAILVAVILWTVREYATNPHLPYYIIGIVAAFTVLCYITSGKPGHK